MSPIALGSRVTIGDVAFLAKVSKTTVSHVLSGNRPVSKGTKERVEEAIRALGYRPHRVARSLRTKTSHLVALVIPDIANPFYPVVARGVEDGLAGAGYRAIICNTDRHPEREVEFLQEMADRGADGIVLDSYTLTAERIASVIPPTIPVMRIGPSMPGERGYDTVHADDEHGARDATEHLLRGSGSRTAMIQGPPGAGSLRNAGYFHALADAHVPVDPTLV